MIDSLAHFSDAIGLVGVSLVLLAYYMLNTNRLTALNLSYQCLNLFGSMMVLISLCFHINLASIVIEFAWMLISILGIRRTLKHRRQKLERMDNEIVVNIK